MVDPNWIPSSSRISIVPSTNDLGKRDKAVANEPIVPGTTILAVPAFATALLDSEKGVRCDYCLRRETLGDAGGDGRKLKKCSGCGAYWYCDAKCQTAHWNHSHKRLCKKINAFMSSPAFQARQTHERMDALLLSHLLAHLSSLPDAYSHAESPELSILLSLLPGPASTTNASSPTAAESKSKPPVALPQSSSSSLLYCPVKPPPPEGLPGELVARFGNNNFTIHSHLDAVAHGVFPLASRAFNHSCVPNVVAKYVFGFGEEGGPRMEVVAIKDIEKGEEVCIPYIDPALVQTRQQVFQITYGFVCACPSCKALEKIGPLPPFPTAPSEFNRLGKKLGAFIGVEDYLRSGTLQNTKPLDSLPKDLYPVLNEGYLSELSERFSKAAHEGAYDEAAESGVTLLAWYLLVYPRAYPQIGMHLLEMAKTQWNHTFSSASLALSPSQKEGIAKDVAVVRRLLDLAKGVLGVMGIEGDEESGPFVEVEMLEKELEAGV